MRVSDLVSVWVSRGDKASSYVINIRFGAGAGYTSNLLGRRVNGRTLFIGRNVRKRTPGKHPMYVKYSRVAVGLTRNANKVPYPYYH